MPPRRPLTDRFWDKVAKSDGCWLWTGAKQSDGYGTIYTERPNRKTLKAHRASWLIHFGTIPEDKEVCHSCDAHYPRGDITYRLCVRPDHLFLGTHLDNLRDMVGKARHRYGHGYRSPKHRSLNEAQVAQVRALFQSGMKQVTIAEHFNVAKKIIHCIVRGKTYL